MAPQVQKARNHVTPTRRATGVPNASSQTALAPKWVQSPCRKA